MTINTIGMAHSKRAVIGPNFAYVFDALFAADADLSVLIFMLRDNRVLSLYFKSLTAKTYKDHNTLPL